MVASLHGKQGRSMFELLVQAWLMWCNGSKLAWKSREIHGWIPDIGMTYVMVYGSKQKQLTVEILLQAWLIWCYGSKLAWKRMEIYGSIPDIGMTYMTLLQQTCMVNKVDQFFISLSRHVSMMLWKEACIEKNGDPLLNSWPSHVLYHDMAASFYGRTWEIHGWSLGPGMTFMML